MGEYEFFVTTDKGEEKLLWHWEPEPDESWTMTELVMCSNNGDRVPVSFKREGDWVYPTDERDLPPNPMKVNIWWAEETWERNGEKRTRIGMKWWFKEAMNGKET